MNVEDVKTCPVCEKDLVPDKVVANRKVCTTKNCEFDFIQGDWQMAMKVKKPIITILANDYSHELYNLHTERKSDLAKLIFVVIWPYSSIIGIQICQGP